MADFDKARTLGLVSGVIALVAPLTSLLTSFLSLFLQPIGLGLVLASLYMFSNIYGERIIFRDALLSVLIGYPAAILAVLSLPFLSLTPFFLGFNIITSDMVVWTLLFLVIILGALIISAVLWYRVLRALSLKSGEGLFRWAGILGIISTLFFTIGALTTVIHNFSWCTTSGRKHTPNLGKLDRINHSLLRS